MYYTIRSSECLLTIQIESEGALASLNWNLRRLILDLVCDDVSSHRLDL